MRAHASLLACLAVVSCTGAVAPPPVVVAKPPPVVEVAKPAPDPDLPLVPLDARVRSGKLKNGMSYFIYDDDDLAFTDSIVTLAVNAGSLDESESQKGAAHLLLHMMYPLVQEDVSDVEDLGKTSFERTQISLNLDNADIPEESEVDRKLGLLRKFADGVRFDRTKVETARTDIHDYGDDEDGGEFSEWAGTRREQHPPYGDAEHFSALTEKDMLEFYRTWYRPDQMAIIVVGNVDGPGVAKRIERKFGSMIVPKSAPPVHPPAGIGKQDGFAVTVGGNNGSQFDVLQRIPHARQRGEAGFRARLIDKFIQDKIAEHYREVTPRQNVETSFEQLSDTVDGSRLRVRAYDNEEIRRMLREIERLKAYGIDPADLDDEKQAYAEMADEPADRGESSELVEQLATYFRDGTPIPSRELNAATARLFATVTIDEVNAVLRASYDEKTRTIVLDMGDDATEQDARDAEKWATATKPEPWDQRLAARPLMVPPTAGTIASTLDDKGMTIYTLANGARVLVRPTNPNNRAQSASDVTSDYNYARLYAVGPGGYGRMATQDAAMQARFAGEIVMQHSGLGDLGYDDLHESLRGRDLTMFGDIRQANHELNVTGSPAQLDAMFAAMHLVLTKPKKDAEKFATWKKERKEGLHGAQANNAYTQLFDEFRALEGTQRWPQQTEADVDLVELDRAFAAFADHTGDMKTTTFIVVGKFEVSRIKPLVETYLASIPSTGTRITTKMKPPIKSRLVKTQTITRQTTDHALALEWVGDQVAAKDRGMAERDLSLYSTALQLKLDAKFNRNPYVTVTAALSDDGHRYMRVMLTGRAVMPPTAEKDIQAEVDKLRTTVEQSVLDTLTTRFFPRAMFATTWASDIAGTVERGEDPVKRAAFLADHDALTARIKADTIKATAKRFGKPTVTVHIEPQ